MTLDHLIHELDPKIIERARRLQAAIQLIREGRGRSECAAVIRSRYPVSRYTAWRVVAIAWDMAGEITEGKK